MKIPHSMQPTLAWFAGPLALLLVATAGSLVGSGQQKVPFEGGIPIAPKGLAARPLPDKPVEFDTGEGQNIRVVVVTKALEYPWSLAFLPDGSMLVTERAGRLRIIRNGVLDPKPVAGAPASYWAGESGLPGAVHGFMDIALHPRFAENRFVYLTYTKPLDEKRRTVAIARGRWDGQGAHRGARHLRRGFRRNVAHRVRPRRHALHVDDGRTAEAEFASGSQHPGRQGAAAARRRQRPERQPVRRTGRPPGRRCIRSVTAASLGLAMHPGTGEMWLNENGPNGGDEINILKPGANYGWPLVSYGRTYVGAWQSNARRTKASSRRSCTGRRRLPSPAWRSTPAIASRSGRAMSSSARSAPARSRAPAISSASCSTRRWRSCGARRCCAELRQRIREVRQGPDGLLYLLTDEKVGAVLRIEPAP